MKAEKNTKESFFFIPHPSSFILVMFAATFFVSSIWAQEPKTLTVVSYPARPPKLSLWLALEEKLFAKYGLNVAVKELDSSDELLRALGKREGDIYAATATHVISGIGDGADLVFIANTGYSVLKLLARPEISRPEELKGKKVGTGEAGSNQDRITRQTLLRLGLNPDKDVTLVSFGSRSVTRLNALLEGKIDATTSNEDNIYDLERRGGLGKVRVLADNDSLKLYIGAGVDFAVSRALLGRAREKVKNFLRALCESIALGKKSRAAADRVYTKYLQVKDPAMLDFMYRTYVQGAIPERPYPKSEVIALGLEEFGAKPGVKGKRAEELIDVSLLKELEQEGFFDRLYGAAR
ncbi:MAG TPA: ABC transporter substrate-binding protein [Candidatus Binatia bacterium]|jgi:ABC-type nitrate/sulfonate/bicarbonate transport system substrate-binding protein